MSIVLDSSSLRTFKAERDPLSSDFSIDISGGISVIPENGNLWQNTSTNTLFQCIAVTPGVSATWSLKPDLAEGTFVPSLLFGGVSTGITYAVGSQMGNFTRIGSVVYLNVFIVLTSKGSANGDATITGLPFPARAGAVPKGLNVIKVLTGIAVGFNKMAARIDAEDSHLQLIQTSDVIGTGLQNVTDAEFSNNSIIQVDGFYYI